MPTISAARFVIAVPDLKASSAFYRDVLGFTIRAIPDPGWLFYQSGECTIMAGQCPDAIPPSQLGDHSYFAYLEVEEIDSLYQSVAGAGVKICKPISNEPWGMREFGLVTVDGHRIMFAKPAA
jgi:predicted enzyme related to lactoylglutathione lyase